MQDQDPSLEWPAALRDRYEIRRRLGSGAMGSVFEARDRALDRRVALKVQISPGPGPLRARMEREAAALARLKHPNVVGVFHHGVAGELAFIAMELVEGPTLDHPPPGLDPGKVMEGLADGLDHVHAEGILHRDLKPANVVLADGIRPVLVDFGLARQRERSRLTPADQMVGTLVYMAPELLRGEEATEASDWYAWGSTLYTLLEGRPADSSVALMARALEDQPRPRTFVRTDPGSPLARLALACLDPRPERRPGRRREREAILAGRPASPGPAPPLPAPAAAEPAPAARPGPLTATLLGAVATLTVLAWLRPPATGKPVPPPAPVPAWDPALPAGLAAALGPWLEDAGAAPGDPPDLARSESLAHLPAGAGRLLEPRFGPRWARTLEAAVAFVETAREELDRSAAPDRALDAAARLAILPHVLDDAAFAAWHGQEAGLPFQTDSFQDLGLDPGELRRRLGLALAEARTPARAMLAALRVAGARPAGPLLAALRLRWGACLGDPEPPGDELLLLLDAPDRVLTAFPRLWLAWAMLDACAPRYLGRAPAPADRRRALAAVEGFLATRAGAGAPAPWRARLAALGVLETFRDLVETDPAGGGEGPAAVGRWLDRLEAAAPDPDPGVAHTLHRASEIEFRDLSAGRTDPAAAAAKVRILALEARQRVRPGR